MLKREFMVVPTTDLTPEREKQLEEEGFERIGESPGLMGWLFGRRVPSENAGASAVYDWCGKIEIVAEGKDALRLIEAAAQGLVSEK